MSPFNAFSLRFKNNKGISEVKDHHLNLHLIPGLLSYCFSTKSKASSLKLHKYKAKSMPELTLAPFVPTPAYKLLSNVRFSLSHKDDFKS